MQNAVNDIIADLLISAYAAVQNIQEDVRSKGFTGSIDDADAVMSFCSSYSFDIEDYALLYANSAVIEECARFVDRYGDQRQRAEAAKYKAFDYNA